MGKREKHTAYLIAAHQRCEAVQVYAVVARSAEVALAKVSAMATDNVQFEIVGGLSRDMIRRLGLKPGQMRLVGNKPWSFDPITSNGHDGCQAACWLSDRNSRPAHHRERTSRVGIKCQISTIRRVQSTARIPL